MYEKVKDVKLKTGEDLEVGILRAPDNEFAAHILKFIGHKPPYWLEHVDLALQGKTGDLENVFYLGRIGGSLAGIMMTAEYRGVGVFGHVFTTPEHRRKGICSVILDACMADFRRRGGRALLLGTGYDSPAYHIYSSFGFRSVVPRSGFMINRVEKDFEERYYRRCGVWVCDLAWRDWPRLHALSAVTTGAYVRSVSRGIFKGSSWEAPFLLLKHDLANDPSRVARVLESEEGAVVGLATLEPDPRSAGHVRLLDLFIHPNFADRAGVLLSALTLPAGKTQCWVETDQTHTILALQAAGFHEEARLARQVVDGGVEKDLAAFSIFR